MSETIEEQVLAALEEAPASGGTLLGRLRLDVLVYGALKNLSLSGRIAVVEEGPGERVWGVQGADAGAVRPKEPGLPDSFSLSDEQIGLADARAGEMTRDLPGFYFQELRRALIARADRDTALDLDVFGEPKSAARFLRRVEGAKTPVKLRFARRLPAPRWILRLLALIGVAVLLRLFVVGVYTVPPTSISMAPALFPAVEDGDALVLANLLASEPGRGEIWIFQWANKTFVKRVMGLSGETVAIREGDLFLDGERWVKERPLLDRVAVPAVLRGEDGVLAAGYPLPGGGYEHLDLDVHDVVVSGRVLARTLPATLSITISDGGGGAGHTLILGLRHGGVAADGVEIAKGLDFGLEAGTPVELWMTNADGCLRVELNGREVARRLVERRGTTATILVDSQGDLDHDLTFRRDLIYVDNNGTHSWKVGAGELLMLGDNSTNSLDSRILGPIPRSALLGRVWGVAWPPGRVRLVR